VAEFVGTNETILSMRVWSFLNWITADECVISTFLFHYSIEAYVLKEKKAYVARGLSLLDALAPGG
jgi:hypothetical protein